MATLIWTLFFLLLLLPPTYHSPVYYIYISLFAFLSSFFFFFFLLSPPPMASRFPLRFSNLSSHSPLESNGSEERLKFRAKASCTSKLSTTEQESSRYSRKKLLREFLSNRCFSSSLYTSSRRSVSKALPSIYSSGYGKDQITAEDEPTVAVSQKSELEFNRVNCLVWVLHESARSFSLAIQTLELARSGPQLANAWVGVDVHAWHKRTAYQVAVYALLKAAMEVESFLSHKRHNIRSPVYEILSPKTLFLGEFVEGQLNAKHPRLVQWFRMVELPRIAGLFIPLFKKWSVEYAGSGVAGVILAISCCAAVGKLGSGRIACPLFTVSIEDILVELMDLSCSLISIGKFHHLAMEGGFEEDFLLHFGKKVLPSKNSEDVEFWIGLVQKKLSVAFHRESVITDKGTFSEEVQENSLATLGIFAFLGRETRLFLSEMNIKDLDEQIKDFLSYLECGSLLIYPEFNSLPEYQLFMEVVTDEIGWLDFYAPLKCKFFHEGRSKQRAIQAEKEIILYTVLTVCYDVFSGFAHYSNSTQQPLDSKLLLFLLRSQTLLSLCLEEYWAAYDKSGGSMHFSERVCPDASPSTHTKKGTENASIFVEAQQKAIDFMNEGNHQDGSRPSKGRGLTGMDPVIKEGSHNAELKPLHVRLVKESTVKLIAASTDLLMGTQLLFIDVMDALTLLTKQLRGHKITKRERKKIKQTLADIVNLVPITILMLMPVSAVGHAAMLAAINRYAPSLIPSPFSSDRLNLVKQLKRTKKMEVKSWSDLEGTGRLTEATKGTEGSSLVVTNAKETTDFRDTATVPEWMDVES